MQHLRQTRKYYITLGLRSMKWDEWIGKSINNKINPKTNQITELDNHYPRYHSDKAKRIQERGSKCCKTAPEAMDAAIELLEELYVPPTPQQQQQQLHHN